jgi:poly-gamma-glutamate synthesis protein (capsule biosynthesis protein)
MRTSYRAGCPVPLADLRYLRLSYWGFDGRPHTGEMVVSARVAQDVVTAFRSLYQHRFPIKQMRLVDDFSGSDDASMAADNTSAFSCRRVAGSRRWSDHARGAAVDINPVENPYLVGRSVRPPAGRAFADLDRGVRSSVPSGAVRSDDVVVDAFEEIGWEWGGEWSGSPDYQHFTPSRPVR